MKNLSFYLKTLAIASITVLLAACNQNKTSPDHSKTLPKFKRKKTKKDPNRKMGIEEMAKYVQNIKKPIGANKSSYEAGYQLAELNKLIGRSNNIRNSATLLDVSERGPSNVPGRIRDIKVAADDNNKWYAGTVGGGIWLTKDAGENWENLTDFKVPSLATSTIALSKTTPGKLYVGTGEPFFNADGIDGIGILKTVNDGGNWTYLQNTKFFGDIGRLAINPEDDDHLVVASTTGVHLTLDGGKTWFNTFTSNTEDLNVQDLTVNPTDFNIIYASVRNIGIIKSTDGGRSWASVFDRIDYNEGHERFEIDISPANPDKLILSVYTPARAGVSATTAVNTDYYISTDAGLTFTLLGFEGDPNAGNLITGQGWYDNILMAHPTDENIFYSGGVAVFKVQITPELNYEPTIIASGYDRSTNNSYVHVDQHGLVFDINKDNPEEFRLILSNDGGIYSSDYGTDPGVFDGTWSQTAIGLNNTQFYGADKNNGTDNYMAGAQDNGSWVYLDASVPNEASPYIGFLGGDGFEVIWNYNDPNKFIGGSQFNGFARVVNGELFNAAHGESGAGTSPFYSKVANANNNPDVIFSPSVSGVWRSSNFGETWNLSAIPQNYTNGGPRTAQDVEVSVANPDIVWTGAAMTENGLFSLHVSKDNGETYSATNTYNDPRPNNIVVHNYFISGLEASPTNENRAYALFSGKNVAKVLKTEDLGQTWTDLSGFSLGLNTGFPDVATHCLIEMPYDEDVLWVGTDIGVIQTTDGGQSWSLIEEIPNVSVWQMKIVNDQVVMATHGRGVWSATIEELEGYEPVDYFAPPTIVSVFQESIENTNAIATYIQQNENVDKVTVYVDGTEVAVVTDNVQKGTAFDFKLENLSEGLHTIGFKATSTTGKSSIINTAEVDIIDFLEPLDKVVINQFEAKDVYTFRDEFVIDDLNGTLNQPALINTDQPYGDARQYRTVLKQPFITTQENRIVRYEDVAIVEPEADPTAFFDYVVLEGTSDLREWKVLDIYDARRFPEWNALYEADLDQATINDELFREQTVDLLNYFDEGIDVALRFRLVTDANTNSFGWSIRTINKETILGVNDVVSNASSISIYPTVTSGEFTINTTKNLKNISVEVFSITGQSVYKNTVNLSTQNPFKVQLNVLSSGTYIVKMSNENTIRKVQRIIVK